MPVRLVAHVLKRARMIWKTTKFMSIRGSNSVSRQSASGQCEWMHNVHMYTQCTHLTAAQTTGRCAHGVARAPLASARSRVSGPWPNPGACDASPSCSSWPPPSGCGGAGRAILKCWLPAPAPAALACWCPAELQSRGGNVGSGPRTHTDVCRATAAWKGRQKYEEGHMRQEMARRALSPAG